MLNFESILSQYPEPLRKYPEHILKEYLQYKILDIIYESKWADKLTFMGGTCIRIAWQSTRFSEDLDFDNRGMTAANFKTLASTISKELVRSGYEVEIKNVIKGAFHCYIRFPGLLYSAKLSGHKESKILIQLDTEPQNYRYDSQAFLLNKFGIFRTIRIVPLPLLLSQKISAALSRKRAKGRDFFDITYLSGITPPDYDYLKKKYRIENGEELVLALNNKCKSINLKELAKDVEPFLLDPGQIHRVTGFQESLEFLFFKGRTTPKKESKL